MAALAVSLGPLAAGLGKGYSSPAIASLQDIQIRHKDASNNFTTFSVTDQQASWVASLSLLGALFGGMFGGKFFLFIFIRFSIPKFVHQSQVSPCSMAGKRCC